MPNDVKCKCRSKKVAFLQKNLHQRALFQEAGVPPRLVVITRSPWRAQLRQQVLDEGGPGKALSLYLSCKYLRLQSNMTRPDAVPSLNSCIPKSRK